jgi:phosphatidylinositol alpha-mannosyltransferase
LAANLAVPVAVSPVAAAVIEPIVGEARVIPNGIDTARYQASAEKVPGRIAFLGRDEPRKGLDLLLSAFAAIRQTRPGAELVVIGATRPDQPGVRFLGELDDVAKAQQLAAAEVFVAPNTGGESFGLVLLEALASGCAVIASSLPAFHFVGGDAALYVPPKNVPAITRALATLLLDDEVRAEYQERARQRAPAFDRQQMVADYLKVYAGAVENRGE